MKREKEKELRFCIWCGTIVPNYRQRRATTCSKVCVHDYNHASVKERINRRAISTAKLNQVMLVPA